VKYSKAKQTLREFLKNQVGKVPNFAAATLLEEGDEEEVALVKELLNDPDERIRLQAAFILALRGREVSALKVLKEAYPHADREMKIHILEAIAQIGDRESIPFLLEIFKEPFQVMRIIAASALIKCLYH
jgi:HEAT repeat protein